MSDYNWLNGSQCLASLARAHTSDTASGRVASLLGWVQFTLLFISLQAVCSLHVHCDADYANDDRNEDYYDYYDGYYGNQWITLSFPLTWCLNLFIIILILVLQLPPLICIPILTFLRHLVTQEFTTITLFLLVFLN